ncbi:MAG: transketolase [Bacteroidales bacterium]|nr:transketolase [Bacteroidales bacterium]MCF8387919.1 transketolase [Bacteroidales bacterium]MCF8396975.1 transketolase [Bacteroidales bacterium]
MPDFNYLEKLTSQVRRDIIRMVHGAKSGHPGGSLGCAEFFVALYFEILKHDPHNFSMDGIGEDIFILSNGHITPVFYSVLARSGYFDLKELSTFRKLNSRLQGHPATYEKLPGVRMASGSLGQGLSAGIGAAQTKKLNNDPNYVYVLTGDGELEEGQIWEAAMYAVSHKVDNLIVTVDFNGQQIDGPVEDVMPLGDLKAKWEAFGWTVLEMNGHRFDEIFKTINLARENYGKGKPVIILMRTEMGKGIDFMEGTHEWHGVPPNDEEAELALSQLEETLGDY